MTMVLAALAGYGFSRFDFPVKKPLLLGLLSTQMFPYVAIMLPIYLVYRSFNLLNTHTGIILGVTGLVLPFSIWMLKTYIDTIEKELEEAALLDGANRFQILTKIVLPLIIPALVAVGMFSFLAAWNHLMYVILLLNDLTLATVPIGFKNTYIGFSNKRGLSWNRCFNGHCQPARHRNLSRATEILRVRPHGRRYQRLRFQMTLFRSIIALKPNRGLAQVGMNLKIDTEKLNNHACTYL